MPTSEHDFASYVIPARVRTFSFFGGRPQIRFQATQAALDMVRRHLQA